MDRRMVVQFGPWLLGFVLVIVYVLIRCLDINLFITTDEPFWLGRSANFYRALTQRDLVHTYQMAHPGVPTMWAGAIAYLLTFSEYTDLVSSNLRHVYGIGGVLRELGRDPMHMLIAARVVKIFFQGILFAITLGYARFLFGTWVMVVGGLLIALDPFVSGMDSLLHVDGLFAIASLTAVLAIAAAAGARPDAMAPWIIAGSLSACAWMTRATGLILVVVLGGVVVGQIVCRLRERRYESLRGVLETPAFAAMLWTTGAMAASLILLPALWVDPFGTMQQVWDWSSNAATEGHERPTFFLGEIYRGDPGLWFYPVTLLWRLTPITIGGALLCLALVQPACRRGWITSTQVRSLAILLGFAVLYILVMSLGAKKFDRYILPAFPVLGVVAAVGTGLTARMVRWHWRDRYWGHLASPAAAIVLILGQGWFLVSALPYRLDYFNPVLGGVAGAQRNVQIGWGEGGREVMDFIMRDAGGKEVTVQTSSVKPIFDYFAPSNITFDNFGLGTPAGWHETDYFVPGIQEWQRSLSPSHSVMQGYPPAHVVEIGGVRFFEVYTPTRLPLPEHLRSQTACTATFGGNLQLMQIIQRDGAIDFYWLTTGQVAGRLEMTVTFILPGEQWADLPGQSVIWEDPGSGMMSKSTIADSRFPGMPPLAQFSLSIQIRDPVAGKTLAVSAAESFEPGGTFVTHSECYYAS